eukprot:6893-Heterococcus_DN1.PRE.1
MPRVLRLTLTYIPLQACAAQVQCSSDNGADVLKLQCHIIQPYKRSSVSYSRATYKHSKARLDCYVLPALLHAAD